ncbi:MAG: HAMP domain-containing histidine kinase, partial [Rhizobiaceae bacterium]|nr:HAMP domain-containing histidine kinase [Rhizobiaceae bacterium]
LLNLSPELLHGSGLFDRIHVADRVGYMCALSDLRDGKERAHASVRLRLPRSSGSTGPDDFRPFEIDFLASSRQSRFRAVLRDRSEIEGLRTAAHTAAEETDALDVAKGRFLAAVSHELRTPLNAIIGFSDILLHEMFGGFTDKRQREYTELIKDSGHHLLAIVNSILDVSKIESGSYTIHPEAFTFSDAVDMATSMMSLQAEKKGVELQTQIARSVGDLVADRRAVQQILINLVSNAVKFTPEKGSVVVGAQRLGSRLHFWVSDTGIGIANEDLDRVGRPFMQVRNDYTRQFEGTGLGLSLVKGLVALHNGTMSIESAPGEGTKVAISLPVDGLHKAGDDSRSDLLPASPEVTHGTLRKTA